MKNMIKKSSEVITNIKGGVTPYVLGWFLGVPASVLVIIFLIRGH